MSGTKDNRGLSTTDLAQEMYTTMESCKIFDWILNRCAKKDKVTLQDPYYGRGDIMNNMEELGWNVLHPPHNYFADSEMFTVTNPPFRTKERIEALEWFFEDADIHRVPFLTILRLEHLGGVNAYEFFSGRRISVWIPKKRMKFITPKNRTGENKDSNPPFHTIFLGYGNDIMPPGIIWVDTDKI